MSDDKWELVTDGEYIPQPGVDQLRCRYVNENGEWTEWGDWCTVSKRRSIDGWRGQSFRRQYEFRKPRQSAETTSAQSKSQPQPQDDWEPITDLNHVLRIGIDQKRWRMRSSETGIWTKWTAWESAHSVIRVGDLPKDDTEWQCRKPKQQPEQPAIPAGSKYKRTICQTLPEGIAGASVIVDIYDILRAWDVTCPAIQHAVKKLLQPGQRGSKSAVQDLREAIGSIERAIQLMGDG